MSTASLTTLLSVLNVHGVASLISYARRSVTERQLSHWLRLIQPQSSGCWIVPGRTDRQSIGDRKAHRVFYEHFIGPIPGGLVHKKILPHGRTYGLECRECRRAAKRRHWAQYKDRLNAARRVARSV